jgi:hypothetical protein
VVGHKIGVLTEPITRTLDLNDDGVLKQPIEECGSDNGIAEDLTPFCEAAVRGEYHGAFLVSCIDELKEQIAAAGNDGQVTDFVDDKQRKRQKNLIFSRRVPSRSALASVLMRSLRGVK